MSDISVQEVLDACVEELKKLNKPYFLYFITATEVDPTVDDNKLFYASYGEGEGTKLTELAQDDIEQSVEDSLTGKINDNIRYLYNKKIPKPPEGVIPIDATPSRRPNVAKTGMNTAVSAFTEEAVANVTKKRAEDVSGGVRPPDITRGGSRSMKKRRRDIKKNKNTKRRSRK